MTAVSIAKFSELNDCKPAYACAANVDLVIVKYDSKVSVLYGRCLHRGALMADRYVKGDNLICGLHRWDYRVDTGVSEYNNKEVLKKFTAWVEDDSMCGCERDRSLGERIPSAVRSLRLSRFVQGSLT